MRLFSHLRGIFFAPYRLSTTILVASSLVVGVLAGLYSALAYERLGRETMQSAKSWSDSVATLVASNTATAFILKDLASMESSLLQVAQLPGIDNIAIFRADGRVLAEAYTLQGQVSSRVGGGTRMTVPLQGTQSLPGSVRGGVYESWSGIQTGTGYPAAWVRVQFSLDQRSAELTRLWNQSLLVTAVLIGLVLASLHFILAHALRPVRQLSAFAEHLPLQIGSHIHVAPGCVEVNQLGAALNLASRGIAEQVGRVQAIVNTAAEAIIGLDAHGRIASVNPAATHVFGRPQEALLGHAFERCVPGLDITVLHGVFAHGEGHSPAQRRIVRSDFFGMRADGTLFPIEISLGQVQQSADLRFVCIVSDVTARVQAERAMSERRARLDAIFSLSPDGFVVFDSTNTLVFANPAFQTMTGLVWMEGAEPLSMTEFLHQMAKICDAEQDLPALQLASSGDDSWQATLNLVHPQVRVLKAQARRSRDGREETILYFRDNTHEDAVDRMKSEFLASAAHELRTPMVSILGFTELLLKRKYTEARSTDMLETIHRQSVLLIKMINELLDLARIESRRGLDLMIAPYPLDELVRNSVKGLMRKDSERQVAVGAIPDARVLVDPEKMQLALNNLLSNAFKYSPNGGLVNLNTRLEDSSTCRFAVIEVVDQGIGMSPEQMARAFERFYRADASGNIPGTGLGLSLVKEVAELHSGRAFLTSQPGQGTTASLWIPVQTQA